MSAITSDIINFLDSTQAMLIVEATFYGLYSATAIMSTYILIQNGVRRSKARATLLLVTIIMYTISSTHLVLHAISYKIQYPVLDVDSEAVSRIYTRLYTGQQLMRRVSYFLSDVVVVWRTWCIWHDSVPVRMYLGLCILATFATSLVTAIFNWLAQFKGNFYSTLELNMLGTFCLLVTNLSTTLLCAYKVWDFRKMMKEFTGSTRVGNILMILVESGAIYCVYWILIMIGDFGYYGGFGFEWMQPHFSGLYVAVIILLVSFQKSSDNMFSQFLAGSTPSHEIQFTTLRAAETATIGGSPMSTANGRRPSIHIASDETSVTDVERGDTAEDVGQDKAVTVEH